MSVIIAECATPIRTLADIEALEARPLESYVWSDDVNDWIRRGLEEAPDKAALTFTPNGDPFEPAITWTYRELQATTTRFANLFHELGVTKHDAVLYLLPTTPLHYAVMLAGLETGIACCVNWMLKPAQLVELVRSSKAKVVVAMGPTPGFDIWEKIESIRGEIGDSVHILSVQALAGTTKTRDDIIVKSSLLPAEERLWQRHTRGSDVAAYVHSGGTTGSPKLVKLTHAALSYKCWANAVIMAHGPDDIIFADYPMFHVAGFFGRGIMALACGMSIIIPSATGARDKAFLKNYWKFIDNFRITILSGVPTTLAVLAKSPPQDGEDLSSLRPNMNTGSTALPVEVARDIERITGVRVLLTYGATEYTQNVAQGPRDGEVKYGSAGLRLPFARFKAVKLRTDGSIERDCDVDEIGVIVISGPSVTPGYVDNAYNEGVFTPDGWFNSGDLGRVDTDGYLWITGRAKDVIIRGGHNIDPSIIEEALLKHPDVMLAAAVGRPDAHAGEVPVAYVQLRPGATATSEALVAFAQERVQERAAAPKDVTVLAAMALTDVGKPDKNGLRRDAAQRAYAALIGDALEGTDARATNVGIEPDATHGHVLACTMTAEQGVDRPAIEARLQQLLKSFAIRYRIEWP